MPSVVDHLLVLLFAVGLPTYGMTVGLPRFRKRLRVDPHGARMQAYRGTMVTLWALTFATTAVWLQAGRSLADLGLGPLTGWRAWVGGAVLVAVVILLWRQRALVMSDADARAQVRAQVEGFADYLPRGQAELTRFTWVSVTAGVCEELLYRGYLMWYADNFVGLWGAVIATSFAFGLGHLYQGSKGWAKITVLGAVLAGLYLLTDSLWVPMILHALIDISSGHLVSTAIGED